MREAQEKVCRFVVVPVSCAFEFRRFSRMMFVNIYFEYQFRFHFKYLEYLKHEHHDYDVLTEKVHLKDVGGFVVSNAALVNDVISTSMSHLRCKNCLKSKL